jgi:hypothetical protein
VLHINQSNQDMPSQDYSEDHPHGTLDAEKVHELWSTVTGKPPSPNAHVSCFDFVTDLFQHLMARKPSEVERCGQLM